jgi:hypothetical protein
MSEFKQYRRKNIAEARSVTEQDIQDILFGKTRISLSQADEENGSPKIGDMVARNPLNHEDQWLIAEKYFKENFEEIPEYKGI